MIEAAFREHRRDLFDFARRRVAGDAMVAEEVVQETFLRAWRSRHRFDARAGNVRMWLFAICRNAACDAARARARQARPAVEAAELVPCEAGERLIASDEVDRALRTLPADQRDAIVLVHGQGRPYAEVAAVLGVPVGTVKSRVHLGLRSARSVLDAA